MRGRPFVRGPFMHGTPFLPPAHFLHPYYAFQPRLSLGFGLWAGDPFAYPYSFYAPFYYPDAYVGSNDALDAPYPTEAPAYPRDNSSSVAAQPNQTNLGGVSFEITPSTAELFVDDKLAGTVGDFTPMTQPFGLEAGRHHIEVRAPGYQTMSFDVDIIAGQVIPYQGTLSR